jgi:hypothetical protein
MLKFSEMSLDAKQNLLQQLAQLIWSKDEKQVNLGQWVCGTQACLGGWIAKDAELAKLFQVECEGVFLWNTECPERYRPELSQILDEPVISQYLFEPAQHREKYTGTTTTDDSGLNHREIVLRRLAGLSLLLENTERYIEICESSCYYGAHKLMNYVDGSNKRVQARIAEMVSDITSEGTEIRISSTD